MYHHAIRCCKSKRHLVLGEISIIIYTTSHLGEKCSNHTCYVHLDHVTIHWCAFICGKKSEKRKTPLKKLENTSEIHPADWDLTRKMIIWAYWRCILSKHHMFISKSSLGLGDSQSGEYIFQTLPLDSQPFTSTIWFTTEHRFQIWWNMNLLMKHEFIGSSMRPKNN